MDALAPARRELVQNAVLFLNDPKASSLQSRLDFLTSKSLTEPEIQLAFALAQQPAGPAGAQTQTQTQTGFAPPPLPERRAYGQPYGADWAPPVPGRDWRDWFIMAVVSGGVVYGLSTLARKYLVPHLQPPSSSAFQETSAELGAQYDRAASLLSTIETRADALTADVKAAHGRVDAAVDDVEAAARAVREGEARWRDDLRDVRAEVDGLKELVPRMIDKHTAAQDAALADLQNELRSLRALLVARHAPDAGAAAAGAPRSAAASPPPWATGAGSAGAAGSGANGAGGAYGADASASTSSGRGSPAHPADRLLRGKSGIPAWQLAPSPSAGRSAGGAAPAGNGESTEGAAAPAAGLEVGADDRDEVGLP